MYLPLGEPDASLPSPKERLTCNPFICNHLAALVIYHIYTLWAFVTIYFHQGVFLRIFNLLLPPISL